MKLFFSPIKCWMFYRLCIRMEIFKKNTNKQNKTKK